MTQATLSGGSCGASSDVLTDSYELLGGAVPWLLMAWTRRLCWVSSRPIATRNSPLGDGRRRNDDPVDERQAEIAMDQLV